MPIPLPIDAIIPEIFRELDRGRNLVIEAPPGAGKTTRVPPALLQIIKGQVIVLEPRRIAARMAARRVAEELGERTGETAGYQVRFEEAAGPRTRLRFVTEGVLTRRLLTDPQLRSVDIVVLDEFHERHLDGDIALALLRHLQQSSRPDLRLIVMSATLDAGPIAAYLECAAVRSEGRLFDVAIRYSGHSAASLEQQVASAVEPLLQDGVDGDILTFLPGAAEIRRTANACEGVARRAGLLILPLHGDLSPEEQDRAVRPAAARKLILSTNVAESSITIDGVTAVIDSGLARIVRDSPSTGLPTLQVQRISKASAVQRAGRAGRTRPGVAIRLYSLDDFVRRPDHDVPEIRRRELSRVVLDLRAMKAHDLPWFEAPPPQALVAAEELLDRLGAREEVREWARYPLHPRLARLLTETGRRGVGREGCRLAALLSSGDRYDRSDVLDLIDAELSNSVRQIERQMAKIMRPHSGSGSEDDLRIALLVAYPDRVARRRSGRDALLSNGKAALLPADWRSDLLVALDIGDRPDQGVPLIRLGSAVAPEWLLDLFPDRLRDRTELVWNRTGERVEAMNVLMYDSLVIEESRGEPRDPEAAARLLAERAVEAGLHGFIDPDVLEAFLARVEFAAGHSDISKLTDDDVKEALESLCAGLRSFAELRQATADGGLIAVLREKLGSSARKLDEIAPERLPLNNRQVRVNYVRGQAPFIASRLQDFFGVRETPRVARGQVPVVVHLLAPNQRPVQMTTDLQGFWTQLYPELRRQLSRRYPKHAWPEKPV
jgi:ATP-dependent helicase HrpB